MKTVHIFAIVFLALLAHSITREYVSRMYSTTPQVQYRRPITSAPPLPMAQSLEPEIYETSMPTHESQSPPSYHTSHRVTIPPSCVPQKQNAGYPYQDVLHHTPFTDILDDSQGFKDVISGC